MRHALLVTCCLIAGCAEGAVRKPAVAGAFYPGGEAELRAQVGGFLAAVETEGEPTAAAAAVVPHAGYVFSGATAARAYAALGRGEVRRVILLGPSHHRAFSGGALPAVGITGFATPLGTVEIDEKSVESLRVLEDFQGPPGAHDPEHSLEVQLPFLQEVAPSARIVPVLLGYYTDRATCRRMARAISGLLDPTTVVVASSDFTHHGEGFRFAPFAGDEDLGARLVRLGRSTAARAADLDALGFWHQVDVSGDTVCGMRPIAVLTELTRGAFDGSGRVLEVTTSGHVMDEWGRVVTYAGVVFEGRWRAWADDAASPGLGMLEASTGAALLGLARATLHSHLEHDESLAEWFSHHGSLASLQAPAGAFVTVNNTGSRERTRGRLRACMGIIEAREPLVEAVIHAAVSAAHDPRFPELEADELESVELEVSVLSPTRQVGGPDEVIVGRHGVVLSKSGRRAVFLPQVAPEQGWDRDTMLDHLALKAGLPESAWREGATLEVFSAQVFAEAQ